MKKIVSIILLFALVISASGFSSANSKNQLVDTNGLKINSDEATFTEVLRVGIGSEQGEIGYDVSDIVTGPQDFLIKEDGDICILDTINERILVFTNENVVTEIDISPMAFHTFAQMFSYYDGRFYVLDLITGAIGIFNEISNETRTEVAEVITLPDCLHPGDVMEMTVDAFGIHIVTNAGDFTKSHNSRSLFEEQPSEKSVISIQSNSRAFEAEMIFTIGNRNWCITQTAQEVLGILDYDERGNLFVDVHEYVQGTSSFVSERTIRAYDENGNAFGYALVDIHDWFAFPLKDAKISADGKLYMMVCLETCVLIYEIIFGQQYNSKINDLTILARERETVDSYDFDCSPYTDVPTRAVITPKRQNVEASADAYINLTWKVNQANKTKPSGYSSMVIPSYVANATVGSTLTGVPYCYGGSDTVANFNTKRATQTTGNTTSAAGVVPGTTGVDCSGFVSCVYETSRKTVSGFSTFGNSISTTVDANVLKKMRRMDWVYNSSHMMLFQSYSAATSTATVVDSSSTVGKVTRRQKSLSSLSDHKARSPWNITCTIKKAVSNGASSHTITCSDCGTYTENHKFVQINQTQAQCSSCLFTVLIA